MEEAIPRVDFEITTENGATFTDSATLRGKGWIDIRQIRLAGNSVGLEAHWPEADSWEIQLPLKQGENVITLEAVDWHGNVIATQSLTVTGTSSHPMLSDLRISEIHYHPADATAEESAAGFDDRSFEFIELLNIGDAPLDLTGVQLEKVTVNGAEQGVDFAFSAGGITQLQPGQRAVVVEDLEGFAARYGTDLPVAGQWSGGLSNNQETITLTFDGQVVQQFVYDDSWYPATDGSGPSLQVVDAISADLSLWSKKEGWQASGAPMGSPGEADRVVPLAGDSNGDGVFDSNDLLLVFAAGKYEDDVPNNASFEEGDWDGDGDFTTRDFVFAFTQGHYVSLPQAAVVDGLFASRDDFTANRDQRFSDETADDCVRVCEPIEWRK